MNISRILYFFFVVVFAVSSIQKSLAGDNSIYLCQGADDDTQKDLHTRDSVEKKSFFKKISNYFADSNDDKTLDKKFDFSIIGGPHYSSDVKLGLGLVAAGLYRVDKHDTVSPPSNVSLYGDVATSGFYLIGIRGNTFFKEAKYRLDYKVSFYSMPGDFWGIGYEMGNSDHNQSSYKKKQTSIQTEFMYRFRKKFYIGGNLNFDYAEGKDFKRPELLNGQKKYFANFGPGIFLLYDSRDYITAPHSGWLFKIENTFYPRFLGNKPHFNRTELTLDFYHKIWEGGVMAYDFHTEYNTDNVPWTMMAKVGGSHRMRGYYDGRYRDKGIMEIQAELRQHIWHRIGATVWCGAGNIYDQISNFHISKTLPNFGLGLRWEFKKRVNVRLDYGFGKKGQSGFIFNINEAF